MKLALSVVALFVCIALGSAAVVTDFGQVVGVRAVYSEHVVVPSTMFQVKTRTVTFRTVSKNRSFPLNPLRTHESHSRHLSYF